MQRWWDVLQLSEPASGSEWMLGILKRYGGNGFLKKNMSHKSLFGSESYFSNTSSWKAGSPISNPLLLKAQSRQLFMGLQQSHSTAESTITASWRPQLRDQFLCFPARNRSFSSAAMKGWAWCSQNAEVVGRTAALRACFWQRVDAWNSKKVWREWIP